MDFDQEYDEARKLLVDGRLPVLGVPGNHDGYAIYTVRLRKDPLALLAGSLRCRKHLDGRMSWSKVWQFTTCLYGDVKELLYADLLQDGLTYWHRQLGPSTYSRTYRELKLIGVNTYSGSARRRHAFSIYFDAFDLHLGAPAVDNYGGYLTRRQLEFVEAEFV